jgi:hypothetical protein
VASPSIPMFLIGGGATIAFDLFGDSALKNSTGTTNLIQAASSSTLKVTLYDASTMESNCIVGLGTSNSISVASPSATVDPSYFSLSGTTVSYLFPVVQVGTTTLVSGVSPSIAAAITANSKITMAHANPNASTAFGFLFAEPADRTNGHPGSFIIRSLTSPGTPTTGDLSSVDWTVTN